MTKDYFNYIPFWKFENLSEINNLVHFITTRIGGLSSGEYESLNLSNKVGDKPNHVKANLKKLANLIGIIPENIIIPDQTHETNVGIVVTTSESEDFVATDALITKAKGICITVLSADCVPILFYDHKRAIVAAAHAGWKGSVANIVGATIESMKKNYDSNPENIIVGIGPSISMEHYEVGSEVIDAVKSNYNDHKLFLKPTLNEDKMLLNLKELNRTLLLKAGVLSSNIEVSTLSTFDQQNDFFSARRSGYNCGRFGAGIMLR